MDSTVHAFLPCEAPVSEPQLRCLLCDLILADATTVGQPTERCRQCGRDILAGQKQASAEDPVNLHLVEMKEPTTGGDRPPPLKMDDLPAANVVPPPLPVAAPGIPTVQPRRPPSTSLPPSLARRGAEARSPQKPNLPPRKVTMSEPSRPTGERPRPQMFIALSVLGCMTFLIIVCVAVIAYAILYGLQKARKVAASPPMVVALRR